MTSRILIVAVVMAGVLTGCTAPFLGYPGNIRTFRVSRFEPDTAVATWHAQSVDQGSFLNVEYSATIQRYPVENAGLFVSEGARVEVAIGTIEPIVLGNGGCFSVYNPATRRLEESVGAGWFEANTQVLESDRNFGESATLEILPQTIERSAPLRVEVPLGPERVTLFFTVAITNAVELRSEPTADGVRQSNRSSSRMRLGVDLVAGGGRFVERFMMGPDVVTFTEQRFDFTRRTLTTNGFANHVAEARIRLANGAGTNQTQVAEYQDGDTDSWRLATREIAIR